MEGVVLQTVIITTLDLNTEELEMDAIRSVHDSFPVTNEDEEKDEDENEDEEEDEAVNNNKDDGETEREGKEIIKPYDLMEELRKDKEELKKERDELKKKREELKKERAELLNEKELLKMERDELNKSAQLKIEKELFLKEK
ncbi:stress response protein NST1-like [Magnolia sinica]|uniref:stress response protein NST1-like n=1 Tax=Magnolia sinica TaxID=86752 RepID=UPI0026588044|nr:stress response protein NST1-like [Magnolia sinica]